MPDVSIKYGGEEIAAMNGTGTKTLKTGGRWCDQNVTVTYTPAADDTIRHWNVVVTGTIVSANATIVRDDWLKVHRADANLCVAVIPRFTIQYDAAAQPQGVYLCTNSPLMVDSSGNTYKAISAYVHKGGSIAARARKYGLTNANDVGDLMITTAGELNAVAYGEYRLEPGEYCVIACLM